MDGRERSGLSQHPPAASAIDRALERVRGDHVARPSEEVGGGDREVEAPRPAAATARRHREPGRSPGDEAGAAERLKTADSVVEGCWDSLEPGFTDPDRRPVASPVGALEGRGAHRAIERGESDYELRAEGDRAAAGELVGGLEVPAAPGIGRDRHRQTGWHHPARRSTGEECRRRVRRRAPEVDTADELPSPATVRRTLDDEVTGSGKDGDKKLVSGADGRPNLDGGWPPSRRCWQGHSCPVPEAVTRTEHRGRLAGRRARAGAEKGGGTHQAQDGRVVKGAGRGRSDSLPLDSLPLVGERRCRQLPPAAAAVGGAVNPHDVAETATEHSHLNDPGILRPEEPAPREATTQRHRHRVREHRPPVPPPSGLRDTSGPGPNESNVQITPPRVTRRSVAPCNWPATRVPVAVQAGSSAKPRRVTRRATRVRTPVRRQGSALPCAEGVEVVRAEVVRADVIAPRTRIRRRAAVPGSVLCGREPCSRRARTNPSATKRAFAQHVRLRCLLSGDAKGAAPLVARSLVPFNDPGPPARQQRPQHRRR